MSRVYADFPWRVFVTTITGGTIALLDNRSTDREFLYTLNGPAYHSGQAASDDFEINRPYPNVGDPAYLTNNRRLIYALRRELGAALDTTTPYPYVPRFSGIVETLEDQGADAPTTRYTAFDPWQYLMSRPARNPVTGQLLGEKGFVFPVGWRASEIALAVLETSDAQDGETHIDWTTDPTLITATAQLDAPFAVEQGQSVGEVWQNLCGTGTIDILLDPIYDPLVRPGILCELRIKPFAGQTRFNRVMGWDMGPHSVPEITRTIDRLANKVRFMSGASKHAVTQTDADSVSANGKYWLEQIIGGQTHQAEADLLALAELLIRRNGERVLTFNPLSDRLDYTPLKDYALGDYVPVWASQNFREPLGVNYVAYGIDPDFPGNAGYQRIYGIPISVDDNGVESVPGLITSQDSTVG